MPSTIVSWTSCGVPFGTVMNRYCVTSTSRPCSLAVGTSGRYSMRSGPKTASGVELAGLDVLDRLADLNAGHVDLVAEHRGQRGRAAVEGHRLGVDVAGLEQQRGGQLGAGADAGGAVPDDAGRRFLMSSRLR